MTQPIYLCEDRLPGQEWTIRIVTLDKHAAEWQMGYWNDKGTQQAGYEHRMRAIEVGAEPHPVCPLCCGTGDVPRPFAAAYLEEPIEEVSKYLTDHGVSASGVICRAVVKLVLEHYRQPWAATAIRAISEPEPGWVEQEITDGVAPGTYAPPEGQGKLMGQDVRDRLCKWLHFKMAAAQNLPYEEGMTCPECVETVDEELLPLLADAINARVGQASYHCTYCDGPHSEDICPNRCQPPAERETK